MNLRICSRLIILFLYVLSFSTLAQDKGFDPLKMKLIKQYKSAQIENGLTVLQQNSKDTNNCFLRAYTNLPEFVSKNYRYLLEIETELRKTTKFKLPSNWNEAKLKELNISLNKDQYGFYATCPNSVLDTALYLFADLLKSPVPDALEIEKAKSKILSVSDSLSKLPLDKIDKITKSIIYGKDHPLLKYVDQTEISSVKLENYLDFYEKFHRPNNSYMLVIGRIYLDSLKVLATNAFGSWKKKELPQSDYKLLPIDEPKIVFFDTIPSGQTEIKILFPFALHPYTFDSEKAELLSVLFQNVLSVKLIQNQKLANSISAKFESDKITGNYQLKVQLAKDSLNPVIQAIIQTISEFKAGKFQEIQLTEAKKRIINDFKKSKTDNIYLSWLIINTERNNLPKEYYADFIDEIEKTNVQGMQTFTTKYLNYNTALFQIPGKWYHSLNDFILLSKNFRIELYALDGNLKKVIPKGFNGFSVIDLYVIALGGEQNIKKIKEVSISYRSIYELKDFEQFFVEGIMIHKSEDKYYSESYMIRPEMDTLFLDQEIYNGIAGLDSSMQGKKYLQGNDLELLKYKSPFVPEMKYKEWLYKATLLKADTLEGNYVWVVAIENPAKQKMLDYYDVDKGLKYKRIINDNQYLNDRTIVYSKYQKDNEDHILYPHLKIIYGAETTIRMRIREVNYEPKSKKTLFEIDSQ